MSLHIQIIPKTLHFRQPAGTSRGIYTTRKVWYLLLTDDNEPGRLGIGECAPLPALSCDDRPDYEEILRKICSDTAERGKPDFDTLRPYPSLLFGLETAFRHWEIGRLGLWDTPFSRGEAGIPVNGLIWMGDYRKMLDQIETKMNSGFRCIKLKIGAIRFEEEINLLRHIRKHFSSREIELRVDANGAFSPSEAMDKLNRLAEFDLHSIEQPIHAGQWEEMARLTAQTPLPIALDEELIGWNTKPEKKKLLAAIRPHYLVLKPSLHGGWSGCAEWIDLCRECLSDISLPPDSSSRTDSTILPAPSSRPAWWITSALESNIGLNAIAQWCATLSNPLPQGLGTGLLFTDNTDLPLSIRKDCLWYDPQSAPDLVSALHPAGTTARQTADFPADTYPTDTYLADTYSTEAHPAGYETDRLRQTLTLHGRTYAFPDWREGIQNARTQSDDPAEKDFLQELEDFLEDWFAPSPLIRVHTSGSTGIPKERTVRKEQMMQSALLTCRFLHLHKGDKALLCMPLKYIAGKMMVVRALVAGLDLIVRAPSGHPLATIDFPLRFAAMIPLQAYNTLGVEAEREQLCRTDLLIIGGGAIDPALEKEIQTLPNAVYSTYGMTETLSHIALRKLNGPDASPAYIPFRSVRLSLTAEGTLRIEAPGICDETLVTNDLADLRSDGSFTILGRKDNTIHTGGVKIQIECVEETLHSIISVNFAITSVTHPKFGEAIVLLVEKGLDRLRLETEIDRRLEKYQRPKYIVEVEAVPQTGSGKTNRAACRELAKRIISKTL